MHLNLDKIFISKLSTLRKSPDGELKLFESLCQIFLNYREILMIKKYSELKQVKKDIQILSNKKAIVFILKKVINPDSD